MIPIEVLHSLDMYYRQLDEADKIGRRLDEISKWADQFEKRYDKVLTAINEVCDNAQKPD